MLRLTIVIVLALLCSVQAFNSFAHRAMGCRNMQRMQMVAGIDIFAKDMELTPTMQERVQSKVGKVIGQLGRDATSANVVLKVVKNDVTGSHPPTNALFQVTFPLTASHLASSSLESHSQTTKKGSQIAEVTVAFRGGVSIHTSEGTDDMYASIDLLSHKLAKSLRRHHDKRVDQQNDKKRSKEEPVMDAEEINDLLPLDDEELLVDLDEKYRGFVGVE
jgi:ribosomal subunit interface protein